MRRRQWHNIEPFICYFRVTGDSGVVLACMNCLVIFFEGSALSCFVAFWVRECLSMLDVLARWKKRFTFASYLCSSHYDANQIVPDYYFSFCATKGSLRNAIIELAVHSVLCVLPWGAFIDDPGVCFSRMQLFVALVHFLVLFLWSFRCSRFTLSFGAWSSSSSLSAAQNMRQFDAGFVKWLLEVRLY